MPETRYRIVFGEHGDLRFIGHLDLQRAWERTFRRAAIQLVYSAGFKPRPRINIGLALPLGCTSQADLLDAWLTDELEPAELVRRLQTAAPPGLMVEEAKQIDGQQPKLQKLIQSAEFEDDAPTHARATREGLRPSTAHRGLGAAPRHPHMDAVGGP
jgi:radical SAM-linked protein